MIVGYFDDPDRRHLIRIDTAVRSARQRRGSYGSVGSMQKILFLDDWCLESARNVARRPGRPTPVPEGTFSDPFDLGNAYPSVFFDADRDRWRVIYGGQPDPDNHICNALFGAIGKDGVDWEIDRVGSDHTSWSSAFPHCLTEGRKNAESGHVYRDPRDSRHPYKLLYLDWDWRSGPATMRNPVVVSADGYRWSDLPGARWGDWSSDTCHTIFFNKLTGRHQVMCRAKDVKPPFSQRLVATMETEDWLHFSEPETIVRPDSCDPPLAQPYGMPTFAYGDYFIGFLWLLHGDPGETTTKGAGPVSNHLVYSINGRNVNRTVRGQFIAPAEPGEFGGYGFYPCSLVQLPDELRIYSVGSRTDHGGRGRIPAGQRRSAMTLHTLRPDGFMYLESRSGSASVMTKGFELTEGSLALNVEAPIGEVRAQVYVQTDVLPGDPPPVQQVAEGFSARECRPFSGDDLRWSPTWTSGRTLDELIGRTVRVEILFERARLYALEVGGTLLR